MDLRDLVQTYPVGAGRASVTIANTGIGGIGGVVATAEAERNATLLRDAIAARYQLELARQAPEAAPQNKLDRLLAAGVAFLAALEDAARFDAMVADDADIEEARAALEELRVKFAGRRRERVGVVVGGRSEGVGQVDDSKSAAE